MLLSRRARELSLSVVLFAVPVVLLYGNVGEPAETNPVDRGVLRVTGLLQRLVWGGMQGIGSIYSRYVAIWDQDSENEALRRQNYELRENNRILRTWAERGGVLEEALGFVPAPPLRTYPADVVGQRVSPFFQVVRVRARPGYRPRVGQAVGVPAGLLGVVRRVSGPYADVLLVGDPQVRVKITVGRTASRGELRGAGSPGMLTGRIEYLSPRDEVQPGDQLLTSGMDGRYPRDLPVGRVVRVGAKLHGRYQVVEVEASSGEGLPAVVHLLGMAPRLDRAGPGPSSQGRRPGEGARVAPGRRRGALR
ncbi:MAG: rod shape-determining protein MreC [Polyangia bacterium]|jgi:rod shape-determining protein MreC|nr:rod shape-determining protein MreC [Polyangia bacterium]